MVAISWPVQLPLVTYLMNCLPSDVDTGMVEKVVENVDPVESMSPTVERTDIEQH